MYDKEAVELGMLYLSEGMGEAVVSNWTARRLPRSATCEPVESSRGRTAVRNPWARGDRWGRGRKLDSFEGFKRGLEECIAHWNTRRRQVRFEGRIPEECRYQALAA